MFGSVKQIQIRIRLEYDIIVVAISLIIIVIIVNDYTLYHLFYDWMKKKTKNIAFSNIILEVANIRNSKFTKGLIDKW